MARIKGSLFVDLLKPYQKHSAEERSWQGHQKDFVQTQGQFQDRTRAAQGDLKDKKGLTRTYEDKPRTVLGQAEDRKGLAKDSHRGKAQFYQNFLMFCFLNFPHH